VAAEEEAQRLRSIAFAMGLQERLGSASAVGGVGTQLLRMVVELVYPPVDSYSAVGEEGESDDEGGGGEEEGGGGESDA